MERSRPSYYLLENKAYSDDGTNNAHRGSNAEKEKTNKARSRWPHALNVVTNFSKPPQIAQRAADARKRPEEDVVEAFQKGHRRLNSSADPETPETLKRRKTESGNSHNGTGGSNYDAALGLSSHEFENTRKAPSPPRDNKGPINNLKRASSKLTNLSPSDRPIVIGISLPSDKLDQHTSSPDAGPTPSVAGRQLSRGRRPSDAPTVTITPAKVESPGSAGVDDQLKPHRRRAPSSLYSRATNARGTPRQDSVPPMPTAPRRSLSLSERSKGRNERITSAYTIFDDDDSPKEASKDRPDSRESPLRILKRSSTDSIATRHRSQGWWNHIMSPFFPKPGAVPWRSTSRIDELVPEIAHATHLMKDDEPSDHHSVPRTRRSSSDHTSIWTDFSQQDAEKKPEDITMLHSPFHESPQGLANPEKDLSDWFNRLGAAAEYYHSCWHDQKYSTPYFECRNHMCIPRRLGHFPLPEDAPEESEGLPEGAEDSRKMAALTKPKVDESNDFQQTPANRFSAAFKEAMTPKSKPKERPLSETTVIDDVDGTPVVHEAQAAPVVRAPGPVPAALPSPPNPEAEVEAAKTMPASPIPLRNDSKQPPPTARSTALTHSSSAAAPSQDPGLPGPTQLAERDAPASLPPRAERPAKRFVAVMPPNHPSVTQANPTTPACPENVSPAAQMHRGPNDFALSKLPRDKKPLSNATSSAIPTTIINHYHYGPHHEAKSDQVSLQDMEPPPRPTWSACQAKEAREQEKGQAQQSKKSSRRCAPKLTACLGRGKPKTKKQKWLLISMTSVLVMMIIVILLLAMLLTRKGDSMEVQSQWLNLTGFPPIPTGISTVIQPNPVQEASGCIHPATLWSCAVPKEQQASIAPNSPNQPNFRLEIRFRNGSIAEGGTPNGTKLNRRSQSSSGNAVTAGSFIRRRLLHVRDFTNGLFSPSPVPPTREDQIFLGNTTDQNQQPFDGTVTPFFISFIPSTKLPSSKMIKRVSASETNTSANGTDLFPDLDAAIPPPSSNADGTASPALLYPLASAQPLRLYNRDTDTEHYGFYTYFDRAIFLKSAALLNFTGASKSEIPDDENGGAEEKAARVRCTWAQTRFLVQIWTRKGNATPLLQSSNSSSSSSPGSRPKNLTESSANDFTRPGSFPYPVSITLDRHGGDIKKKMIYCYGLDQQEHIISEEKQIQLEDRAFGGTLINPAQGPFGKVNVTGDDGGPGGIDGGSGGCGCTWENFSGGR